MPMLYCICDLFKNTSSLEMSKLDLGMLSWAGFKSHDDNRLCLVNKDIDEV